MLEDLKVFADRSRYRPASVALIFTFIVALASVLIGIPAWLSFVVGVLALILLTIITYYRLGNANLSSGWVLLMVIPFGIGPSWHLSENVTFNVGGSIVGLIPIILGWFASAKPSRPD